MVINMINIDTEKVKKSGQDIVRLSEELNEIIESMYYKICNMPTLTGEWVGGAAELFVKQANIIEKKDALDVKQTLKKFGNELINCAEKYEIEIKNNV